MGKYSHLKNKLPKEHSERDAALLPLMEARKETPFAELAAEHTALQKEAATKAAEAKVIKNKIDAVEALMEDYLNGASADRITTQGFNWSTGCEPYASAEDPAAIIKYFEENGMADQLALKATELAARLKNFVKEEALANELTIEEVDQVDEVTGEVTKRLVAKSKIPGVKVFLKTGLEKNKAAAPK